jgi:hypothetical protein
MIARNFDFSIVFQGRFCRLPLLRVIFNRKLGDYYAIRSNENISCVSLLGSNLATHTAAVAAVSSPGTA